LGLDPDELDGTQIFMFLVLIVISSVNMPSQ